MPEIMEFDCVPIFPEGCLVIGIVHDKGRCHSQRASENRHWNLPLYGQKNWIQGEQCGPRKAVSG